MGSTVELWPLEVMWTLQCHSPVQVDSTRASWGCWQQHSGTTRPAGTGTRQACWQRWPAARPSPSWRCESMREDKWIMMMMMNDLSSNSRLFLNHSQEWRSVLGSITCFIRCSHSLLNWFLFKVLRVCIFNAFCPVTRDV